MELAKYKICPSCGQHNPPTLIECGACEADLTGIRIMEAAAEQEEAEADTVSPAPGELVKACEECGAENPPQARKCQACGEDISDILPAAAQPRTVSYRLESADGAYSLSIDAPLYTIGRNHEMGDYLETKPYVSRRHAKLTVVSDDLYIEDLSNTNNTFINNELIPDEVPIRLREGDEIGLGGKVVNGSRQNEAAYFVVRVSR